MFDWRMEQEIFPYCQQQGIGGMVYGLLGGGLLTGTFTADTKCDDYRGTGGAPGYYGLICLAGGWLPHEGGAI